MKNILEEVFRFLFKTEKKEMEKWKEEIIYKILRPRIADKKQYLTQCSK